MSVIAQALNTFSNYLSNEADKKKKESLFYRDYFQKQMSAKNAIDNIQESGLIPKDYNVNPNIDPTYTLENIQGLIGLQDKQRQRTKEDFILDNQMKQAELQKFLTNNGLVRQGGQILYNQFDDSGKLLNSSPIKNAGEVDPRLADTYNDLQNQITDDKRQAEQLNWNKGQANKSTPKFQNYVMKDGNVKTLLELNGQILDPNTHSLVSDYDHKVGVGYDENNQKYAKDLNIAANKEKTRAYTSGKQIVTAFKGFDPKAEKVLEKYMLNDKGNTDYVLLAEKLRDPNIWEDAGFEKEDSDKFFKENNELFKELSSSKNLMKLKSLQSQYDITDEEFRNLYNEYLDTNADGNKFEKMKRGDILESLINWKNLGKPQSNATNQNQPGVINFNKYK